jgi:putative PIN family toxin of toxin-antitoxin system
LRVVFDANVLVSALISRAGAPARLLALWLEGEFELVVCQTLLDEVEKTLRRPKISERVSRADADAFVRLLRELAESVADPKEPPAFRSADPDDDYLIAIAARERVPLVSGDQHLLDVGDRLPIVSPREFLDDLEKTRTRRA